MAAERLRLMRFDNRLITDSFQKAICILKWQFSINDKFKTGKYEPTSTIYCRNGDTLGPTVWLEQGNQGDQGDQHEQDDQGEVSIIIFGMSESSGFQKCLVFQALCLCFPLCHFICLCICVLL